MRRMVMAVLAIVLAASTPPAHAQDAAAIDLELQDGSTGEPLTDSCFVLDGASNEGCDENADGRIRFEDIAPGTSTVRQSRASDGFLPIGDFTITVAAGEPEQSFVVVTFPDTAATVTVDVRLALVDAATGDPVRDGCFVFEGGSLEGCDENGDGAITFDGMPAGAYRVRNTVPADGYDAAPARWVNAGASKTFTVELTAAQGAGGPGAAPDIALVTRDPETSAPVTGTCYVLVGFSNEGCDENGDGRVTFDDVPAGTYEVEQTRTPGEYPTPAPFRITVSDVYPEQGFVVRQGAEQNAPEQRNVSILLFDSDDGALVTDSAVCVRLGDYSREGCDDNRDGQIDFLDIPFGTYDVVVTNGPASGTLVDDEASIEVGATDSTVVLGGLAIDR